MSRDDVIVQEQILHVPLNDFLQQDNPALALRVRRKLHDTRKHGRNLYHGKFQFLVLTVFFLHQRRNV